MKYLAAAIAAGLAALAASYGNGKVISKLLKVWQDNLNLLTTLEQLCLSVLV